MKTFKCLLALLALALGVSTGRAQSFTAPITGGGGGTVTGSVWFPGPFTVSGTNWYLHAAISNLTINLAFTNYVDSSDNVTTVLSNVANGTRIEMEAGTYTVTPSILNSNLITSTVFQGAKLINKTNITIKGVKGLTIFDGSAGLGEVFVITNCDNVTIEGVTFRGYTNHNFMALPGYGGTTNQNSYLWALVNYYACSRLTFKDCTFERSADHGLQDKGAEGTANGVATTILSTNQILIINNTFNDIGGMRTNQAGGLQTDGTAIVCTDARITGNLFVNCFRGVEPYNEGEASGNSTFANCVIQGNQFINIAESYITLAGSTNGNGIVVDGNFLYREPGFTYHGTNTDNGFGGVKGVGINMNGGDRHIIRGNVIRNMLGIGIAVQTSGANPVEGVSIVGNFIDGVTNSGNQSYGIFLGDPIYSVIFPVRNAYVANNTIRNAKTYAIYGLGLSDSTIENNELVNPVFPGAGSAITLQSFSSAVISNVVVRQNQIKDTGTAEMTYGLEVTAGSLAVQTFDNRIEGGTTGTINNGAGTGLTQFDTIASSTNRLLRAHEVRTQIEAGSNITLATNSSGVLTIAGAAGGSSGTNFAGIIVTNLADIKGNATITSNLTVSGLEILFNGAVGSVFSTVNVSNTFGAWVQFSGMFPGVNKVFASQDASGNGIWTNKVWLDAGVFTNSVTVLGGASAAIMGINSFQGDAMAFTRATNSPAATGSTNDLQFDRGTVKLGDTMTLMSSSAGQHVWTNGIITLLVTDTNSITIDCALAVNNYVIPTLATNFTVSVTNIHLVRAGRSISVEFPTNLTTSALQVTNAAALGMKWNSGFSTNGYPCVTKTNTRHFSMLFTFPQTNYPVIDAAFY